MNWLGHAIDTRVLDYVFISLSVLISLCLFGTLKLEAARRMRKDAASAGDLESRLQTVHMRIEQIEKQLADYREAPAVFAAGDIARAGVNLTKRSNALRLHRLGAEANVICRTLGVVKGELALMIKVQKLISRDTGGAEKQ